MFIKDKVTTGFQTQASWSHIVSVFDFAREVSVLSLSGLKNNFIA